MTLVEEALEKFELNLLDTLGTWFRDTHKHVLMDNEDLTIPLVLPIGVSVSYLASLVDIYGATIDSKFYISSVNGTFSFTGKYEELDFEILGNILNYTGLTLRVY